MTISINGISLSDDLVWNNQFDYPSVAQSVMPLLGGGVDIRHTPESTKGREITLIASSSGSRYSGYFTHLQIKQLKAVEKTGSVVSFIYESTSLNVILKSNGINAKPLIPRPNIQDDDLYTGTITMIEV